MATTRRRYTAEFKREAVRLSQQREVPRLQVARTSYFGDKASKAAKSNDDSPPNHHGRMRPWTRSPRVSNCAP